MNESCQKESCENEWISSKKKESHVEISESRQMNQVHNWINNGKRIAWNERVIANESHLRMNDSRATFENESYEKIWEMYESCQMNQVKNFTSQAERMMCEIHIW